MAQDKLNKRIAKKENDILKLEKKIEKLSNKVIDIDIINKASVSGLTSYTDTKYDVVRSEFRASIENLSYLAQSDATDLMNAFADLRDATATLNKYKVKLDELINYENEDKIEVLVTFLNKWREDVREWYIRRFETYITLKNDYKEAFEKYKAENIEYVSSLQRNQLYRYEMTFREKYYTHIPKFVVELVLPGNKIDIEKLDNNLDKEVKVKYKDLVKRITKVVGEIKDVSNLSIGNKGGEINGIVIGTKGKARIETISAGGYNIQIFHYRVLVHKVKE